MTFMTQFVLGTQGMPRRYYSYLDQFQPLHAFSSIGSYVLGAGFLMTAICLLSSLKYGAPAGDNPWGATTLEWKTSSPPPLENFDEPPVVTAGPYDRTPAQH
jgi:cytochrome c oxidase subunit 1